LAIGNRQPSTVNWNAAWISVSAGIDFCLKGHSELLASYAGNSGLSSLFNSEQYLNNLWKKYFVRYERRDKFE